MLTKSLRFNHVDSAGISTSLEIPVRLAILIHNQQQAYGFITRSGIELCGVTNLKIEAIKYLRAEYGISLMVGKVLVEEITDFDSRVLYNLL